MKLLPSLALLLALISAAAGAEADATFEALRTRRLERPPPGDVKSSR